MKDELLYNIALTQIPQVGSVHAKNLLSVYGDAKSIFKAPRHHLEKIEGIGTVRAAAIRSFQSFSECEQELIFLEKKKIVALYMNDEHFPKRLLNCYDHPILLYYRGNADLNAAKIIAIVGTRNNSEYGKMVCEQFISSLKDENILIISGLAFGIDTLTHKNCLKQNIATVGVLAHSLDRIYPAENKQMAKQMLNHGGLLTEFKSGTKPDRENFPKRNRIVAGMADAIIVIESGKKGGSIITAEIANGYNRDVFAVPGRINDERSDGCNFLITQNKAMLLTDADQLLEIMNWKKTERKKVFQTALFLNFSKEEQIIVDLLKDRPHSIDDIYLKTKLTGSQCASALLMLEMNGVIISLPGKIYQLNH